MSEKLFWGGGLMSFFNSAFLKEAVKETMWDVTSDSSAFESGESSSPLRIFHASPLQVNDVEPAVQRGAAGRPEAGG